MDIMLERLDASPEAEDILIAPPQSESPPVHYVLGRAPDCHFRVDCSVVSRHHCELILDEHDHAVRVRDLGSQNGTFVNADTVIEECELRDGDKLVLGCVPFEVHIH